MREILVKKFRAKVQTSTAIGSCLKFYTKWKGASVERKMETYEYAHFESFISFDPDEFFQTSQRHWNQVCLPILMRPKLLLCLEKAT